MKHILKSIGLSFLIIALCSSCSQKTVQSSNSTGNDNNNDILAVLLHRPYLEITGVSVHHESDRNKIVGKIENALQESPCAVVLKDGGLFSNDYYAVTSSHGTYYYYGNIDDNRPDGFGILSQGSVELSDYSTLDRLVYAGNFKNGRFNEYGVSFRADTEDEYYTAEFVDSLVESSKLSEEYKDQAVAYLRSYVTYDGEWKNGVKDGTGNVFLVLPIAIKNADAKTVLEGYWGGLCYPSSIHTAEVEKGEETGQVKTYSDGILRYDGNMKNGVEHGNGIYYYGNGQIRYDGQWKNGKYDGKGKMFDEDGSLLYDGKWKDGDYAS